MGGETHTLPFSIGTPILTLILITSGPTRSETPVSEAASYANLAAANEYFGLLPPGDRDPASSSRILLEERALDSYYNILFSLVLFWRKHHAWPRCLTIVSHAFKRRRIVDGHCAALGFPSPRINFVGINPPGIDSPETPAAERNDSHGVSFGEQVSREKMEAMSAGVAQVADDWTQDPHGSGVVLARKRKERNPWNVGQKLFSGEEERMRSGVRTQILEDGTEVLAQDLQAPWGPGS